MYFRLFKSVTQKEKIEKMIKGKESQWKRLS